MTSGQVNTSVLGKATSTNNCGQLEFKYNASGSTTNLLGLGFWGNDFVWQTDGSGNTTAKGKAASVGIQDTTGGSHVSALVKFDASGNLIPAVSGTDYPAVSATPVIITTGTVSFSSGTATITNAAITATSKLAGWSVNGTPSANSSDFVPAAASGSMTLKATNSSDSDTINYTIIN